MNYIEQQWQADVEAFGELAYLMWSLKDSNYTFTDNEDVKKHFVYNIAKWQVRKPSAALPFDFVAAKAGDVVEIKHGVTGEWQGFDITFVNTSVLRDNLIILDEIETWSIPSNRLRMKHPRYADKSRYEEAG